MRTRGSDPLTWCGFAVIGFQSAVMRTRGSDLPRMGELQRHQFQSAVMRTRGSDRNHRVRPRICSGFQSAVMRTRGSDRDNYQESRQASFNPLSCGQEVQTPRGPRRGARHVSIRCHADKRFRPRPRNSTNLFRFSHTPRRMNPLVEAALGTKPLIPLQNCILSDT